MVRFLIALVAVACLAGAVSACPQALVQPQVGCYSAPQPQFFTAPAQPQVSYYMAPQVQAFAAPVYAAPLRQQRAFVAQAAYVQPQVAAIAVGKQRGNRVLFPRLQLRKANVGAVVAPVVAPSYH